MSTTAQPSGPPKRVRKLLSLDGGGVRGLSSIMILRALMTSINHGREEKSEPWQEFDMIGGTSTGGLLAIMLGRLRMSVVQCEKSYVELSGAIFAPRRNSANVLGRGLDFLKANGRFDESPLEEGIKAKVVAAQMDADALLEDHRSDCKVSVYFPLRSY
jgi:patatin-like phospholipase/acyl hydrolase